MTDSPVVSSSQHSGSAESASPAIDPALLAVLVSSLRADPRAAGLPDALLASICEEAASLGKVSDAAWLEARLGELSRDGLGPILSVELDDDSAAVDPSAAAPQPGLAEPAPAANQATLEGASAAKGPSFREIPISRRAEITTREDLEPVLQSHQAWIESVVHPAADIGGGRANLEGASLAGFNLDGVDLRGANLKGAVLDGASLKLANLSTADLRDASLKGAALDGAKLRRALLQGAIFEEASLKNADLRLAETRGAKWEGADLEGALREEPPAQGSRPVASTKPPRSPRAKKASAPPATSEAREDQ